MFGRKGKASNYAYTAARVKAKKAHLLAEDDYSKMLMMTPQEISRYISEAGYTKEMTDLANRESGLDLLEHATYANMANVFSSILLASTGGLYDMVSAYLTKWDNWNLKVILRGKSYGLDAEGIREDLVPAGSLGAESLEKLVSLEADDDILAAFGRMTHINFPQDVLAAYKARSNLAEIEDYLDKRYYEHLLTVVRPTDRPSLMFRDYVMKEIDIKNFETILKLKLDGVRGEPVMKYVIPGGKQIDSKLASQLAAADTVEEAVSEVAQIGFYEDIKDALDPKAATIREVVSGMKKYEMHQAKKFSHLYPLSVIPVLDYMIHKENEVNNIRTVARGAESGLDRDVVKGLLVI
ncbi:MAG: ATP synthase A1 subunit C [Candidatus Methanoplasma sp.]|jgi:V/A-type H+-transporting ATPase subunit C|nr:ATP synthase A1 subunit C [Candidatus Methanoplasma sp.]